MFRLHPLAPAAHIPVSILPETPELIATEVDRDVNETEATVGIGFLQGVAQLAGGVTPENASDAGNGSGQRDVVHGNTVTGLVVAIVLRHLQAGDGAHAPIVEEQDTPPHVMLDSVKEDLGAHDEAAVAAEGKRIDRRVRHSAGEKGGDREPHV